MALPRKDTSMIASAARSLLTALLVTAKSMTTPPVSLK